MWSTGSTNITSGYNTYGFQYIPGQSVTVYFNGKQVYQDSRAATSRPQAYYLLIELQVASSSTSGWHTSPVVQHAEPVQHGHLRGPGLLVDPLGRAPAAVRPPHRFSSPSWSVAAAHLRRRSGPAPEPAPAHRRWGPAVRVPGRTPRPVVASAPALGPVAADMGVGDRPGGCARARLRTHDLGRRDGRPSPTGSATPGAWRPSPG